MLLQTDLSWLGSHKGVDLLIGGGIVIGAILCWKTIPLFLHGKKEKELAEIEAKKEAILEENNSLIRSTSARLENIENALTINSNNQMEVTNKLDMLNSENKQMKEIILEVSCDTQYSVFINEKANIFERLKAFRNLTAFRKNGEIREKGFNLVRNHKDEWREVEKLQMKVPIQDMKYWNETMKMISDRIFEGF